jgi:hypothetical protein
MAYDKQLADAFTHQASGGLTVLVVLGEWPEIPDDILEDALEVLLVVTEEDLTEAGLSENNIGRAVAGILAQVCHGLPDEVTDCWRRRLARLRATTREA